MLFVGDDWAEDHHDVEVQDQHGRTLRTARLPEGVGGMARFHDLVAGLLPDDATPARVLVCIETDRGPWVRALIAAGVGVGPATACRSSPTSTLGICPPVRPSGACMCTLVIRA